MAFEPTILTNVRRNDPAHFEKFSGPVAQIYVVKTDEKIVERAKSPASHIETGAMWINTVASSAPELPFGGVKRSGCGRELSALGIKEFVNQKLVLISQH